MKEDLCYVSCNFREELLKSKRKAGSDLIIDSFGGNLKKYFALPDYQSIMRGFAKRDDEIVTAEQQVGGMRFYPIREFLIFSQDSFNSCKSDSVHGDRKIFNS